MKGFFDMQIAPEVKKLEELLSEEKVGEISNYKDQFDVLHIRELDHVWEEWHLKCGKWVKQFDSKDKPF